MDMRKDTTPTTDAAKLDTIKAAEPADLQSIEAQEPRKEGKKRKSTTSAATITKYQQAHYDRFELKLTIGDKDKLRAAAAAEGISANALIIKAVNTYLDSDILTPLAKNPYI